MENAIKPTILAVGSECVPFAKTGGLADVLGTLPRELVKLGYDARVMLPLHRIIKEKYGHQMEHVCSFTVLLGQESKFVGIEKLEMGGVTYYFVDNEQFFGFEIYKGGDLESEQYIFFSRAVLESLPLIGFIPDVIQANDWQAALIPVLIKAQYGGAPQGAIKTVFTIHNLMYQGKMGIPFLQRLTGLPNEYFTSETLEAYGCANLLKGALVFADKISTVSPTYAQEIQYPYFAEGMEGMLSKRRDDIVGILNGMDVEEYDPSTDRLIPYQYTKDDLEGKYQDKKALMERMDLNMPLDTPLIGVVSRLTSQKGLDLILRVFDELMRENVGFVLLGNGEKEYEDFFLRAAYQYHGRVGVSTTFDNALAHQIYAGCDLFLMPSRFEPCGISQMIALRYGTLPIVRETGGLKDTVFPYNKYTGEGNGFSFTNYNAHDMLNTIRYALNTMKDKIVLGQLIEHGMSQDNSFLASAKKYGELFETLVKKEEQA